MSKFVSIVNYEEELTYELATFGERLGARFIDGLIILIPSMIIPIIPAWLYWALQQSGKSQATVGQKVFGIKVIDADGDEVSFGQATGRFFGNIINVMTFFMGYLMFFFGEKNQCLHDHMSNCLVVKEREFNEFDDYTEYLEI